MTTDAGATVPISDADRVIASLRKQFRACYQKGLQLDRELDGCVVLSAKVDPEGSVVSSEPVMSDRLTPEVIGCIAGVVRNARFNAPGGGGSTLLVPITFIQQRKERR